MTLAVGGTLNPNQPTNRLVAALTGDDSHGMPDLARVDLSGDRSVVRLDPKRVRRKATQTMQFPRNPKTEKGSVVA